MPVKIEIEVGEDYVDFRHSGKPFSLSDLTYLVHQTSLKEWCDNPGDGSNVPDTTGKFGTGFMTTHLLSKVVTLSSIFYNEDSDSYQRFSVDLDRDADNKADMILKYEEIFKVFERLDSTDTCPYVEDFCQGANCDTSFKY